MRTVKEERAYQRKLDKMTPKQRKSFLLCKIFKSLFMICLLFGIAFYIKYNADEINTRFEKFDTFNQPKESIECSEI